MDSNNYCPIANLYRNIGITDNPRIENKSMNERQLRFALAVRDEHSFSGASKLLLVSQPNVSEQVGLLEEELGFALFRRTGRGIEITESGQIFLHRAEEVMKGFLSLTNLARQLRPGLTSSFSMGMSSGLVSFLFPIISEAFTSDLPHVQPSVMSAVAPQIQRWVSQGDVNVGFTVEFTAKGNHPILTWERVAKVDMALFVRPDHPLAGVNIPIGLKRLAEESIVMNDPSKGFGLFVHSMFTKHGLQPNIVATADNPIAIKTMIQSGMGIAILPALAAFNEINLGQLARVPIKPKTTVSLYLIRQKNHRDEHIETCIEQIRKIFSKYDWSTFHRD